MHAQADIKHATKHATKHAKSGHAMLMLSACSPDPQTNKIAETPRAALEQAKQTSALVDEQAAQQQKEIDAATGQ